MTDLVCVLLVLIVSMAIRTAVPSFLNKIRARLKAGLRELRRKRRLELLEQELEELEAKEN